MLKQRSTVQLKTASHCKLAQADQLKPVVSHTRVVSCDNIIKQHYTARSMHFIKLPNKLTTRLYTKQHISLLNSWNNKETVALVASVVHLQVQMITAKLD